MAFLHHRVAPVAGPACFINLIKLVKSALMTPETLLITINLLIYNKCLINFDWQFQINLIQSQPQVSVIFCQLFYAQHASQDARHTHLHQL